MATELATIAAALSHAHAHMIWQNGGSRQWHTADHWQQQQQQQSEQEQEQRQTTTKMKTTVA